MNISKELSEQIDLSKGIGMICLVLGHLFTIGTNEFKLIFAFHMPLFFFISGYLFVGTKYSKSDFFKNKIGKLLWTYILFVIIGTAFHILAYGPLSAKNLIISSFYRGEPSVASALWFLTVLALIWIISYLFPQIYVCKNTRWKNTLTTTVVCIAFSYLISRLPEKAYNFIPLKLGSLPLSFLFFYYGRIVQDVEIKKPKFYLLTAIGGGYSIVYQRIMQHNGRFAPKHDGQSSPVHIRCGCRNNPGHFCFRPY